MNDRKKELKEEIMYVFMKQPNRKRKRGRKLDRKTWWYASRPYTFLSKQKRNKK
jgi:hypothetical protein